MNREVGTLGIGADDGREERAQLGRGQDERPEAWAPGTHEADDELGTGVMGRGEDLLTRGETHARAAEPGLPIEDREPNRRG